MLIKFSLAFMTLLLISCQSKDETPFVISHIDVNSSCDTCLYVENGCTKFYIKNVTRDTIKFLTLMNEEFIFIKNYRGYILGQEIPNNSISCDFGKIDFEYNLVLPPFQSDVIVSCSKLISSKYYKVDYEINYRFNNGDFKVFVN